MSNNTLDGNPIDQPDFYGTYHTARLLARCISFVGWVAVTVGVGFSIYGISSYSSGEYQSIVPSLYLIGAAIFAGLVTVCLGQIMRANVDTADYNAQILELQFHLASEEWKNLTKLASKK